MNKIIFTVVDLLAIAVISILSFALFPVSEGLIIAYIFLVLAVLMQFVPLFLSDKTKDTAYKTALYSASGIYFAIQLIISLSAYVSIIENLRVVVSLSTIIMVLDIAVILIVLQIGMNGDKAKQKENAKAYFIDKIIYNLEKCKNQTKDADIISTLDNVIEKARYSNLNSPSEAGQTESNILDEIENADKYIKTAKTRELKTSCDKIISLLSEREMLCKLYK